MMSMGPTGLTGAAAFEGPTGPTGAAATDIGSVTATVTTPGKTDIQLPPKFLRPNFDSMPPELKQLKNWVLWVPIWNGTKWTKRPIQPSGYGASTTNPKHWRSFGDAQRAYEDAVARGYVELRQKEQPPKRVVIGGVGFVFDGQPDQAGLVFAGVDFDKVIKDGDIASLAAERVKRLNSYTERSVSGDGLHVIAKAHPLRTGIAHGGVEIYTSGRFFTMTGCALNEADIIAAADEVAALVDDFRAQTTGSRVSDDNISASAAEGTAEGDGNNWLPKLPPDQQSEVVKYAALHIAEHSKLLELTRNGGNYQEYLKLTLAIARSAVPDAEKIFVEAASLARDADTVEDLRKSFQNCAHAQQPDGHVTVGTLLHTAGKFGADFSQWKKIADSSDPDVALYLPGEEDRCRKLLDRIVAADPRTFTLGDPTGPLVILRVPEKDVLPLHTLWNGDLPGTTLATPADVMLRAEQLEWKQRGGGKSESRFVRTHPPRLFVADYLIQMRGQFGAPPLRGIVRVPRIDDNGAINFISGYDPHTGLFHDRSPDFNIPQGPSLDDARRMAEVLLLPFSKYHFDDHVAGRALVLAAIFTALERPFLSTAPMFVVRSPMPATGKGKFVRGLVRLAFDTAPVVITWGGSSEEFEKRLGALLLHAPAALMIDNANGMQIQGDLLESIITEGRADIRPLGHSEIVKVRNRTFNALTGNNPTITGDMARRTLPVDIQPASADPERVRYGFDPVKLIQRNRPQLLQAAFTAMRAFRLVGMPAQRLPAVGSFDDWSRRVRDLVYWLTAYDVSEAFRRNKADDPRRQADASLLAALHQHFGPAPFKGAEVIAVHDGVSALHNSSLSGRTLHDALDDVLGSRGVNAKLFGYWARRMKGVHNGGLILETQHDPTTNANVIAVRTT